MKNIREIFDSSPNYISKEVKEMSDCRHNTPNRGPDAGDVQTQWQQLDEPSNEELLDRLVDCLYSFEGDTDISSIDRCLEELEQAGAPAEYFDVEQSLQEFHERYAPAFENSSRAAEKRGSRVRRPLARIAIIAAALCAFMVTAQASGFDILGAIARWTSEQFSFVAVGDEREDATGPEFDSLVDALEKSRITERLAPTKFPNGTELDKIQVNRDDMGFGIFAAYLLESEPFYISVRKIEGDPYGEIEINDPNIEIYSAGGVEHHIMADVKQNKAFWKNGSWECYIAGNLSREDLTMMIDSIYE